MYCVTLGCCFAVMSGGFAGVMNVMPACARAQLERHPALVRYVERMLADVFGAPLPAAPAVQAADWGPRAEPGAAPDPPDAKPWWCARRAGAVPDQGAAAWLPPAVVERRRACTVTHLRPCAVCLVPEDVRCTPPTSQGLCTVRPAGGVCGHRTPVYRFRKVYKLSGMAAGDAGCGGRSAWGYSCGPT